MEELYQKIIDYILIAGKRISEKAGKIDDIGILKPFLTEEDIKIERDLKRIIEQFAPDHLFCAEEENSAFVSAENVWVADPISGTSTFIAGLPHYSIVVSHVHKGESIFAAVYDPSMKEMFIAYKGRGSFLNGKKIHVSPVYNSSSRILLALTQDSSKREWFPEIFKNFSDLNLYRTRNSFAINYCHVACGRYDGVLTLQKDSFPEFAGKLIIEEAGGILTNAQGEKIIHFTDRIFIGGNAEIHQILKERIGKLSLDSFKSVSQSV